MKNTLLNTSLIIMSFVLAIPSNSTTPQKQDLYNQTCHNQIEKVNVKIDNGVSTFACCLATNNCLGGTPSWVDLTTATAMTCHLSVTCSSGLGVKYANTCSWSRTDPDSLESTKCNFGP